MRALLFVLGVAGAALARADVGPVSAVATARDQRSYSLSAEQLELLDSWLHKHRWRRNFATPPTAAFSVAIKQADGATHTLAFFDEAGWAAAVTLDGRIASSSAEEVANLREKLGGSEGAAADR